MADPVELVMGGLAACGAVIFSNPLDVVRTRFQLQGELRSRGQYSVHYRNVFQALYVIGKTEGLMSLQKGLTPACFYQFCVSGLRLGIFQTIDNNGLIRDHQGNPILGYTVIAGAFSGATGAMIGSPFNLIKIQLQSQANSTIAVGYQHQHTSFVGAFRSILKEQGITGLWKGSSAQILRATVGSGAQLTTFSKFRVFFDKYSPFENDTLLNNAVSSIFTGAVLALFMTPFDVVVTRLFNQPVDSSTNKGLIYTGLFDCFRKIHKTEGFLAFYKGLFPTYLRTGPHTVLTYVFWREIRKLYYSTKDELPSDKKEPKPSISHSPGPSKP